MGLRRNPNADLTEVERRVSSVIVHGVVEEANYEVQRVRVRSGGLLSDWIPWVSVRAGGDRTWAAPEVGEQVIIAAPGGDMALAAVIGTVYRDEHPAPADSADITRTVWQDGTVLDYDRENHVYRLQVASGGRIDLSIEDGASIVADGNKVTIKAAEIVLDGTVRLGTPGASRAVHGIGDIDSDNDVAVTGADQVFIP